MIMKLSIHTQLQFKFIFIQLDSSKELPFLHPLRWLHFGNHFVIHSDRGLKLIPINYEVKNDFRAHSSKLNFFLVSYIRFIFLWPLIVLSRDVSEFFDDPSGVEVKDSFEAAVSSFFGVAWYIYSYTAPLMWEFDDFEFVSERLINRIATDIDSTLFAIFAVFNIGNNTTIVVCGGRDIEAIRFGTWQQKVKFFPQTKSINLFGKVLIIVNEFLDLSFLLLEGKHKIFLLPKSFVDIHLESQFQLGSNLNAVGLHPEIFKQFFRSLKPSQIVLFFEISSIKLLFICFKGNWIEKFDTECLRQACSQFHLDLHTSLVDLQLFDLILRLVHHPIELIIKSILIMVLALFIIS